MKKRGRTVLAVVSMFVMLTGCVATTRVRINTGDVEGATVYIDGEEIGRTPLTVTQSNGVWNDPDVLIRAEGFRDLHTGFRKELKAANLVFGIVLWVPSLLWVYGPKKYQNFMLYPQRKSESQQQLDQQPENAL